MKCCECMRLFMRGHFRSGDKDGGHTNLSGIVENSMYTQTLWLYLHRTGLMGDGILYAGVGIFDLLALVTLTLTR